jgi:hypothetical protein
MTDSLHPGAGADRANPLAAWTWHGLATLKNRRALRAARSAADDELVRRQDTPLRLAWRAEELVAPKNRLELAHSLRSLVRDSAARYLPSASPVNRAAVRGESETLLALAARLADVHRAVAARGVLLVDRLLVDGSGPLYERARADQLHPYLERALGALEPR